MDCMLKIRLLSGVRGRVAIKTGSFRPFFMNCFIEFISKPNSVISVLTSDSSYRLGMPFKMTFRIRSVGRLNVKNGSLLD